MMNLDNDKKTAASALSLGVIGHPIGHSLSPLMQQAWFDQGAIAGRYQAYDLEDIYKNSYGISV